MKESEDKFWKEEILKDFEKPTNQGFTDDVMKGIDQMDTVKSISYEPLISTKQWLVTALIFTSITLVAIFLQYKVQFELGYFEEYSQQFLEFLNENTAMLWVCLSLVSVFFAYSVFGKRSLFKS